MVEEDPASADHQGCPTSTFDGHTVHAKYKQRTETELEAATKNQIAIPELTQISDSVVALQKIRHR